MWASLLEGLSSGCHTTRWTHRTVDQPMSPANRLACCLTHSAPSSSASHAATLSLPVYEHFYVVHAVLSLYSQFKSLGVISQRSGWTTACDATEQSDLCDLPLGMSHCRICHKLKDDTLSRCLTQSRVFNLIWESVCCSVQGYSTQLNPI